MMLLEEAKQRGISSENNPPQHKVRLIANAAGGLLPSTASELQRVFGAVILPSYGMTECMPITAPPADYKVTHRHDYSVAYS